MEAKFKNNSFKIILIAIGIGIWVLVLQNAGIIPSKQNVYVSGGFIDADVNGKVNVENQVDVNLDAINGKNAFYDFGGDGQFVRIPVMTTYPSRQY